MGIWVWIIAAWILSYLALGRKKVHFEHLLWILLPVDMYGISFAGATIKPYMIFCGILLIRFLLRRNWQLSISKWLFVCGVLSVFTVIVNLINSTSLGAAKAACMLLVVWGCVVVYMGFFDKRTVSEISDVLIASAIGYGIVFIVGYLLLQFGMDLPGIVTANRESAGFFLQQANSYQGTYFETVRLRGYTIDPNTMTGTFAFCAVCCLLRITNGTGKLREWLGMLFTGVCILLSNSRMGLICFVLLVIFTVWVGYRQANTRMRNRLKLLVLFGGMIFVCALVLTNTAETILNQLSLLYGRRSSPTGQYGRFSIWRDAISVLFENSPLFGVGMGQMRYYTLTARDTHNTWLDMLCSNGLLAGGWMILHFVAAMVTGLRKMRRYRGTDNAEIIRVLGLGILIVACSLISVDNLTYSYLWFGAALLSVV